MYNSKIVSFNILRFKNSKLAINTTWNLVGSLFPIIIGLCSIPLLLNKLGLERFGILSMIWVIIGYFSIFDFGIGRALTYEVSKAKKQDLGSISYEKLNSGIKFTFFAGVIGGLVLIFLSHPISHKWLDVSKGLKQEFKYSLIVSGLALPFVTTTSGVKGIIEGLEDFKLINIIKVIMGVTNFLFPLFVSLLFGPNLFLITISLFISRVISQIIHIIFLARKSFNLKKLFTIKSSNSFERFDILRFGFWMTLSNIVSPLMINSDRFVISHFLGADEVSYYSVPFDLVIRALVIPAAFSATLFPRFNSEIVNNPNNALKIYSKSLFRMTLISILLFIVLTLVSFYGLKIWISDSFSKESTLIMFILSFGIFFNSMAQIPYTFLQSLGKVKLTAIIHIFEFFGYSIILIFLVHRFGIIGAAWSFVLRVFIDFLLLVYFQKKYSKLIHV